MAKSQFEAPTLGLGRLLSEGTRFVVPAHQREYSWTEDELSQFFADIRDAQDSDADYYFIGLMVFMPNDDGEFVILDGQQRMATAAIIISAIRTWLRGHAEFQRDADQIQSTYIAERELGEDALHQRLVLNEANNDVFYNYVVCERPSADIERCLTQLKRHDPSRTLLQAVLYCRNEISRIASAHSQDQTPKALFALVNFIRDTVRVVRLVVPSESDAFTVFETLNDRGLDLTVLDLVKNFVFGRAGTKTRLAEFKLRWAQMMAVLSNVRGDDFLKAYWTSRYGRTQKAQLFPSIKTKHKTADRISQFSKDMARAADHYAAIELADDPLWESYSDASRDKIRTLKMLRSQSIYPVILSGLARFNQREMERLLTLLEVLIVRYQLVGGGRTGLLEIASARLAEQIFTNAVTSATAAFQSLKDIYPSDNDFRDAFVKKQEKTNVKVQYLLRAIEKEYRRKRSVGLEAQELVPTTLTVEHIFPRNPGALWKALQQKDPQFAEECTYRLGNLTLLSNVNRELGQDEFADKKSTYAKSSLFVTKDLAKYGKWDRDAVETRQIEMAKLATSIWRFQ